MTRPDIERVLGSRGFLAGVLCLAAALRVGHVFALRPLPLFDRLILDSELYDAWGQAIASGDWLSEILAGAFYMDPLYSYFLGGLYRLVGRDLLLVRLIQSALGVGTCALVAVLGRRLRSATAGNLGALLLALYGGAVFQEGEFEKTALGVFLATWGLVLFLGASRRARFAAGFVLGLAALTRGNMLLLVAGGVAFLMLRREWRSAAVVAAGAALAIAPVTLRNHHVSGQWVLTGAGFGQNLYTGNNPSNPDGGYHSVPFVRPQTAHEEGDFLREAERRVGHPITQQEASAFWANEAVRHVLGSPGFAAGVLARKLGLFWSDVEIADGWDQAFISRFSLPLRFAALPFSLLAALAMLGIFRAVHTDDGRVVVGYVGLYCVSVVIFFIFSRYRIHVAAALAALGGCGVAWLGAELRARNYRPLVIPLALSLGVGAFSAFSFPSRRGEAMVNHAHLAEMYQERNDFGEARRVLDGALARAPQHPELLCAMGKLGLRTNDAPLALEYTGRCLQVNPVFADGWYLHGLAREAAGDAWGAESAYRRQLSLVPGHELALARLRRP